MNKIISRNCVVMDAIPAIEGEIEWAASPPVPPRPNCEAHPGRELRRPFPPNGEKSIARLCRRLPNFRLFRRQVLRSQAESEAARRKVEDGR